MRLVAFSDVHLDTPFASLPPAVGRRRRAQLRDAVEAVARLARDRGAHALLCAGDLYEHHGCTPDTAAFLARVFAGIAPCPVLVAPGNHDHYSADSVHATTAWPPNVHVFSTPRLEPFPLSCGVTVWGAAHVAPAGTPNLLAGARASGPGVHVALFHGSERTGLQREGDTKLPHAPFDRGDVDVAGFHLAVVGHYHRPALDAAHLYPGSPVPLGFGDPVDGGAVVVDIEADGSFRAEWHRVHHHPLCDVEVQLGSCGDGSEVRAAVDAALAGRHGIARLVLTGELAPHVDLTQAGLRADDLLHRAPGLDHVQVVDRTTVGYDLAVLSSEAGVRGEFVRMVLADDELDPAERHRVIVTGLRAFDRRRDLEVVA
jgi:DNA repair exonuclease SbcCD nuclease subunit